MYLLTRFNISFVECSYSSYLYFALETKLAFSFFPPFVRKRIFRKHDSSVDRFVTVI